MYDFSSTRARARRKDHISKIDLAQKSHDEKWGFLNGLQPQVRLFAETFAFIYSSTAYLIGDGLRSQTISTIAPCSGECWHAENRAHACSIATAAAVRQSQSIAAARAVDHEQLDRLANGGQELHAREVRQLRTRPGISAQEIQMARRRLRLTERGLLCAIVCIEFDLGLKSHQTTFS